MIKKILFPLLIGKAGRFARDFQGSARRVQETQRSVLLKKIRAHQESDFGEKFHFRSITDIASFRKQIPLTEYSFFQPYIERVKQGDVRALFGPGTKILMFAMTSGTTKEPKYIPVTCAFLSDYRRGWLIWGFYVYSTYPSIVENTIFPLTSAYDESYTPKGIPCGAISGLTSEKQNFVTRLIYTVTSAVYRIKDVESKYYTMMRLALQRPVGSITTANPSTVLSLVKLADRCKGSLLKDIHDGTLSSSFDVPSDVRRALRAVLKPDARRARELEGFASRRGELLPLDYWPTLGLVTNWKGGTLSNYLRQYPHYFGQVPVWDIGLIASEGRMTIPMQEDGSSGVLDVSSHFFEFIPEDEEDKTNPTVLLAHELTVGQRYFIILTTSSGLYRYNIHDLVEVTGMYHQAPVIRFLNKGRHISSMTGEKLTEYQVVEAMKEASRRCSLEIDTFTLVPRPGEEPRYVLMIEQRVAGDAAERVRLCAALDEQLQALNIEYAGKRKSNRLAAPDLLIVRDGSFEGLKMRHIAKQHGRAEQYKHIFLTPDSDFSRGFDIISPP